jgi:hypothetical protein
MGLCTMFYSAVFYPILTFSALYVSKSTNPNEEATAAVGAKPPSTPMTTAFSHHTISKAIPDAEPATSKHHPLTV